MIAPEQLAAELETRRTARLLDRWKQYPRTRPIASDLGDCDRQIALSVLAWSHRPTPSAAAMERMEQGNEAEQIILKQLRAEGWKIVQEQLPFELRGKGGRVILSGKMEGLFQVDNPDGGRPILVPFEIKDTSAPNFMRWNTEEDLRADRWARKWYRQFQAYLVGHAFEWGVLILAHRGQRKAIVIRLDYAAAETILQRAERATEVVAALDGDETQTLDESLSQLGLPYLGDPRGCLSCDFAWRVCFPPRPEQREGGDLLVLDEELAPRLERLLALQPLRREAERLERWLDKEVPKGSHAIAGDLIVTGAWEKQNLKAVPAKPAVPAGTREIWKRVFTRTGQPAQGELEAEAEAAEA